MEVITPDFKFFLECLLFHVYMYMWVCERSRLLSVRGISSSDYAKRGYQPNPSNIKTERTFDYSQAMEHTCEIIYGGAD